MLSVTIAHNFISGSLGERISGAPTFDQATLCIVGAGKMSRLLVIHMASQGVKKIILVNRSVDKAKVFASEVKELSRIP
jgi:glutamyl-tRNA reductase